MAYPPTPSFGAVRNRRAPRTILLAVLAGGLVLGAGLAVLGAVPAGAAELRMLEPAPHPGYRIVVRDAVHPPTIDWSIAIATVGLQAEIDACQWVRMDFTSDVPVPIVAAHNFCGGGIVLEMVPGQTVALSGTGLDGTYLVVGSKDAWADEDAVDAIAGLSGDVILQTCYWEDDGHLILVALQRIA
jgi:hypothetical protein